jgi:hypothetical protein
VRAHLRAGPLGGDPDEVPEPVEDCGVQTGDLVVPGDHRLLCGDSTRPEDVARVMDGSLADICWTDPPYNVAVGDKRVQADHIANDDLGEAFPGFCAAFCAGIKKATKPGAPLCLAMSSQEWPTIDAALRHAGFHWSTTIIWSKDSFVLSRGAFTDRMSQSGTAGTLTRLVSTRSPIARSRTSGRSHGRGSSSRTPR